MAPAGASAYAYPTALPTANNSPSTAQSIMDDTPCRRFFLEPIQPLHRRFAALHAFFVEGLSAQAIGERFGVSYHTVRSWVRDFRDQCHAGQLPPFSFPRSVGDRAVRPRLSRHGRKNRPRPIAATSICFRGGACAPASPLSSCSCRCWPACAWIRW